LSRKKIIVDNPLKIYYSEENGGEKWLKRKKKRLTEGRIAGGREPKSAERLSIVDMLIARQRERKGQKGQKKD
jgi:hypothetical protein